VGFVVGTPGEEISRVLKTAPMSVFVPTAPNPTSGYIIIVPPDQITDLNMSVDDALKFIISLGVVVPGKNGAAALENSAQVQKPQSPPGH
jgi:uncharacterized membrane protein